MPDNSASLEESLRILQQTTERLILAVREMSKKVNTTEAMQKEIVRQQGELRTQRFSLRQQHRIILGLAVSLILNLLLVLSMGIAAYQINENAERIGVIQDRTSNEVLCPQYALWLALLSEQPDEPRSEREKERVERFRKVFQDGYIALNCKKLGASSR